MQRTLQTWVVAALLIVAAIHPAMSQGSGQHWVATWGTAQQAYRAGGGRGAAPPAPAVTTPAATPQTNPAPPAPPAAASGPQRRFGIPPSLSGLNNQTIRMVARTSIGGDTVRIRLSHAFGASSVTIGAARIAIRASGAGIVPDTDRVLTFSGKTSATLYGGQLLVSDPVRLGVKPLSDLAVSLYFPAETGPPTGHTFGLRPTYVSGPGDFTSAATIADITATMQSYYWLTGIDVIGPADAATVVTFGDSITDGDQSTPDTIGMWPALLATRLQANRATARVGVVNAGISGNRLLGDNTSGLARLMRDALAVPGVKWITVLEGINDITGATRPGQTPSPTFTAESLIAAYRQIIETAHMHGVAVIGCTITPYGGSNVHSESGEAIRQAVNTWIRTGGAFDAVIDFDAATRDPKNPARFRTEADSPDLLHPGDAGYRLMAEAIDLAIFTRRR